MSDSRDPPAVVAYVGPGGLSDPEGRVRLERVDAAFVADYAAYADCVVCEVPGGGLEAIESLSGTDVPTVLYDRTADPIVAAWATRLGVSEYVTDGSLGDRTLADLIARLGRREGRGSIESDPAAATMELSEELTPSTIETAERFLALGREHLELGFGALAVTDGAAYSVVTGDGAVTAIDVPLSATIYRATVRTDCPLELPDTAWGPPADTLADPFARLGSYVGDDFPIGDGCRGTVWFGDDSPRSGFAPDERTFLRLLARRLRAEIGANEPPEAGLMGSSLSDAEALVGDGGGDGWIDLSQPRSLESDGPSADSGSIRPGDHGPEPADDGRFRRLFDRLPDAVADVEFRDGVPIVREVNEAFEETFGYDESAAVGTPLDDLIVPDDGASEDDQLDEHAIRRGYGTAEVERETESGRRKFLFRGFSYHRGETERGFGIYTDITDRIEQGRRLRVLHRVLRHNLRNEMTAIIGYADMLAEEGPTPEYRTLAERIYEEATDVSKLGEQVRRIEQALDLDRQRVAIDPEPLVDSIAEGFRQQHPEATIRISADAVAEVVADELLETAIENLVENAIEHHPGTPSVEIHLSPADGDRFDIAVRDDGPGIPERERAVVSGDREITQLDHSRGLGLWVSQWVVRGVDGQLLFGDPEAGAEVILRLRRAEGRTPE
jgi:PAS domain S-box-containing protein